MNAADWLAPTVLSSIIAGLVGLATHYSAQRARKVETSEDIRSEAFDQAKAFYVDIIARQDQTIDSLRADVKEALRRATVAEEVSDATRSEVRTLQQQLTERDREIDGLKHELHGEVR